VVGLVAALVLAHPCLASVARGPAVPAPLALHTSCGWYEHDPDGRTFRLPNHWGAVHGIGSGRRYGAQLDVCCDSTRHISLRLHGRLVWRSRGAHPGYAGQLAFGPHEFAFADYHRGVFLTDMRGPERLVVSGRGLYPDDFTRNGDLVVVAGNSLVVVSRHGRVVARHLFRRANGYAFDWRSDTYLFVTPGGRLAALRGRRVRSGPPIPRLSGLSVLARGLIAVAADDRLTVMREDGSVVATGGWNSTRNTLIAPEVSVSPDRRTFVYALSTARRAQLGAATVFVLHPGDRRGHRLLRRWRSPTACFEGGPCAGGFDWDGRFFIYAPGDGHVGIVDSATGGLLDLTRFDRSLPQLGERPERAAIGWKSEFPR
jgi:hypothetical protein